MFKKIVQLAALDHLPRGREIIHLAVSVRPFACLSVYALLLLPFDLDKNTITHEIQVKDPRQKHQDINSAWSLRHSSSFSSSRMADIEGLSPTEIISGLAEQRDNGILCDVELKAEGAVIPAHRSVLAAASPFFHAMFTGEFKEKNDKIVTLNDITYDALKVVIDAVYKHELVVTNELVAEVVSASHLLQMSGIVERCKTFMIENMSQTTCFTFLALAEKYEFQDLAAKANDFVLRNFIKISKSLEFKNISKEALCNYLSSDSLKFENSEAEVFEAARQWLKAKEGRMQFVGEVMNKVRFMLMSADELGEISDKKIVENNIECQKLIRDAFVYQANIYKQSLIVTD